MKILVSSVSQREQGFVTQKVLTPQIWDGQMICSVDCRERNGVSSSSMIPMIWAPGPVSGTFWYFRVFLRTNFSQILAKLLFLDKNV